MIDLTLISGVIVITLYFVCCPWMLDIIFCGDCASLIEELCNGRKNTYPFEKDCSMRFTWRIVIFCWDGHGSMI